jgi:O-antigen/teichoic acid export membrane protein
MAFEPELAIDEHRRSRDRRAMVSTVAAVAARSIGLLASFVSIPIAIAYLGSERYGLLVALTSLTAMLIFADMGLGNGLLNAVSTAYGRGDRDGARIATSSAFAMLVGIAMILAATLIVVHPRIDWATLLNAAGDLAASEAAPAAAVVIVAFIVAVPLGIVERLRMAYQEGFYNSIAATVGALLALVALVAAVSLGASLPVLLLAISAAPIVAALANGVALFRLQRPWLRPSFALARIDVARGLARVGLLFLILQVAVAIAFQSDVLVAAIVLGPDEAATYAVTLRFFLLAPTFIGLYLVTLWPAYSEAIARGDIAWVRRTLRRSTLIAFALSVAGAGVLVAVGPWLITTWTRGVIQPPIELLFGAAVWSILMATFTAIAMLFNAASVITFQVVTAIFMATVSVLASVWLAGTLGVAGIVIGTVSAYALCSAIPMLVYLPRLLRRLGTEQMSTEGA